MVIGQRLTVEGKLFSDPTFYRSFIGALQYLTITRSNLAYAVNIVYQYMHAPTEEHSVVKRI